MNALLQQADIRVGTWRLSISAADAALALEARGEPFQRWLAAAALAPVLAETDAGQDSIVVIDRLRTPPLHVDARRGIAGIELFNGGFREVIATALQSNRGLAFSGRPAAVVGFARAVARRDATQLWVWRGLGFLRGDATPATLAEAAAASSAMAALAELDGEVWPALMQLLVAGDLPALWRRAEPSTLAKLVASVGAPDPGEPSPAAIGAQRSALRLILAQAPAFVALTTPGEPEQARLAARLATLPVLSRLPGPVAVAGFIAGAASFYATTPRETPTVEPETATAPATVFAEKERPRGVVRAASPTRVEAAERRSDPSSAAAGEPVAEVAVNQHTEFGGLLFLLHLVPESGLFLALARGAMAGIGLAGVLQLLATVGFGVPADDPVVPVFGGLWPGRFDAPGPAQASPRLRRQLARLAATIEAALRQRVPNLAEVATVLRRAGELEVTPGKAVLHLRQSQVDTAIRRAGLDADPGFLPWLGMVVRFRYE